MATTRRLTLILGLIALAAGTCGDDGLFEPDPNASLYNDDFADRFIRRTSEDLHAINPDEYVELLQYRIGNWLPDDPAVDLFAGSFYPGIWDYFRLDLLFDGLVNPPGPREPYDPLQYGANPLFLVLELDVDNFNTGGELDRAQDYFLGNVARFGARLLLAPHNERTARRYAHTQMPFQAEPQVRRMGHDFDLCLGGPWRDPPDCFVGQVEGVEVRVGDDDETFESGEVWVVTGRFFCRAHGYEFPPFWAGLDTDGSYCPEVQLLFSHSATYDKTTVSLVFPIINFTEPNDYDDENEVSIMEALEALVIAAQVPGGNPEDALIEDWANQYPIMYSMSTSWALRLLASTCLTAEPTDDQYFVWTDLAPNHTPGDFNGDSVIDAEDALLFETFVARYDGDPDFDSDGDATNGSLTIPNYPKNFSIYDKDYSGIVEACDYPRLAWLWLWAGFDRWSEWWHLVGEGGKEWTAEDGNPPGCLIVTDTGDDDVLLRAPPRFDGDLSDRIDGTLSFDARLISNPNPPWPAFGTVTIGSSTDSVSLDLAPDDPGPQWTTYAAPLTASAWGVDAERWAALLGDVTDITVNLEAGDGAGEVVAFDNFLVAAVQPDNDCNANGEADECDIADGTSQDDNGNGIPDECECAGDLDGDGDTDHADLGVLLADWGCVGSGPGDCPGDLDADFDTDHSDLGILLADWGCVP